MTARQVDEWCVLELFATSSGAARERYRREDTLGTPAYDPVPPYRDPRDYPVRCPRCERLVWASGSCGPVQRYCSSICRVLFHYHANAAYRRRALERARATYWRSKAVA